MQKHDYNYGTKKKPQIFFRAYGTNRKSAFPVWRYHKHLEPIMVQNAQEDIEAKEKGYKHLDVTVERGSFLFNYMIDLEDFTPRQLSLYIRETFEVDLPESVGLVKLIQAVWKLTVNDPENKERVVLLAQSIKMNYDETVDEIYKLAEGEKFSETVTEVFYA